MDQSVLKQRKMLPLLMRAFILILLGILTVLAGARLYAHKGTPQEESIRPAKCSGCPLASQCADAPAQPEGK